MRATYRLQLHPDFTFADVEALIPYFTRLGVSHLYLSPTMEARPGSMHGYDVIDHNAIREELGGREAFERLLETAHEAGLGLILDFVPNHAGVGPHNEYWQDVLSYGPHAEYASYFDIDWEPLKPELHGKILLPFLGKPYGEVLDEGELGLAYEAGRFYATYYENRFALNPRSFGGILEALLPKHERKEVYFDIKDLADAYATLERHERDKAEALRPRLTMLAERVSFDEVLASFSGEALHELLEEQFWRLAFWKTAGYEVNYRRFFSINNLVALRMEDEHVFWDAHRLVTELLAQEGVDGLRIDHIDGLFDPHAYLERLRDAGASSIWVEKILAPDERLPEAWPVEGTTGYEFMNDVMGVLLDPIGERRLNRSYRRFVPDAQPYREEVYQSKRTVMETSLSSELARLSYELDRLSESDYHTRDFTLQALRDALTEIVAAFERYRTYLPYDLEEARELVEEVTADARRRTPAVEPSVYAFIAGVLFGEVREDLLPYQRAWVARFQQYTAPVAAKGVEDTAFYRYLRLVALNEVGGDPDHFGRSVESFHERAGFRAERYPRSLLATATHDHKRGEDTRMRLITLAEMPDAWEDAAAELFSIAEEYLSPRGPSEADCYQYFQILTALWKDADHEALPNRLWEYMLKASRESKRQTSWISPDEEYEAALEEMVRGVLNDERTAEALEELTEDMAEIGFRKSLSQQVLKLTTPGVPDIYQGTELMDLSLVDPDNRRPVDYERREALLEEMGDLIDSPSEEIVSDWIANRNPRAKLFLIARLLRLRSEQPALFESGYRALELEGEAAHEWLAFAREDAETTLLVAVPRLPVAEPTGRTARVVLPEEWTGHAWRNWLKNCSFDPSQVMDAGAPLPWVVAVT